MWLLWLLAIALTLPAQTGRRLFEAQCALCHGQNGGGGRGPSLLKPKLDKAPNQAALEKVIAEGLQPEMPGAWQLNPAQVKDLAAYVMSMGSVAPEAVPGDALAGKTVYQRLGCASCHIVQGVGSGFGPELTTIGARRNAAHLREAIVDPAATLPEGFQLVVVTPLAGAAVQGIRLGQDPFTIQIVDAAGRLHSFKRSDLKSLEPRPKQSPMPAYRQLNSTDLQDLVAYLASLKGDRP